MATPSRLLTSGAALVSAAALIAATPSLAPSMTPTALSTAKYELASFADVLKITPNDVFNAYMQGWGGAVSTNNDPAVEPYATGCSTTDGNGNTVGGCYVVGLSGILYLYEDALINGNGLGPAYVAGGPGIPAWGVSALNYFYEPAQVGYGISGGLQYMATTGLAANNPILATVIALAFGGPALVSTAWVGAWTLIENAVANVPVVGPYIAEGINAYLNGYGSAPQGLSGLLAYVGDLLTGAISNPAAASAAAVTAVNPAASFGSRSVKAVADAVAAPAAAPVAAALRTATPGGAAGTPAAQSAGESATAGAEATPAAGTEGTTEATPTSTEPTATPGAEVTTDSTTQPTAEASAQTETPSASTESTPAAKPAAPAATPRPSTRTARPAPSSARPVRDAVEKVTGKIAAALGGAKAGAASADAAAGTTDSAG